jgi:hypothetical protein
MDEIELARVAQTALKKLEERLAKGEHFYNQLGRRLTTPQEILECIAREHKVKVETIDDAQNRRERAQKWRDRAEKMRRRAEGLRNPEAKRKLLNLASGYDQLAALQQPGTMKD